MASSEPSWRIDIFPAKVGTRQVESIQVEFIVRLFLSPAKSLT